MRRSLSFRYTVGFDCLLAQVNAVSESFIQLFLGRNIFEITSRSEKNAPKT
jgi:hypothetical protein